MAAKLTQPQVKTRGAGRHSAGDGLYLLVKKKSDGTPGSRSWVYRYRDRVSQKLRDHGLGPANGLLLSDAKKLAAKLRAEVIKGGNPIDDKQARLTAARVAKAKKVTFGQVLDEVMEARRPGWKNRKHASQWSNTLADYCGGWMNLPVSAITTQMVTKVLTERWSTQHQTARRVQQRIAVVLDRAISLDYREGPNPARWTGHLEELLPSTESVSQVVKRPALPYRDVPALMADLGEKNSLSAKALKLQILTALRPGEAAGAQWSEIDLAKKVWTIPAKRMKVKRNGDHLVPLSPQLVAFLKQLRKESDSEFLFPGLRKGSICTDTMLNLVKAMRPNIKVTSHGFRSSFRDWAAENTRYQFEAEVSLAHSLDKVVAAYLRTEVLDNRAKLMTKWSEFCFSES